jgi:signal transduction histidine kinase
VTSVVGTRQVVEAFVELVPALLLAVTARTSSRYFRGRARRWVPHPAWLLALHYVCWAVMRLVPLEIRQIPPPAIAALQDASVVTLVLALPGFRHLQEAVRRAPVAPRWVARTWTVGIVVAAFAVLFPRLAPLPGEARMTITRFVVLGYCLPMVMLILRAIWRHSRPGAWRPGNVGGPSRWDVVFFGFGIGLIVVAVLTVSGAGDVLPPALHVGIGLAFALPGLVPVLGQALRELAIVVGTTAMAALVAGGYVLVAPHAGRTEPALLLAAAIVLLAVMIPGQTWVRSVVDRRIFARGFLRRVALQEFVQTLSPEDGTAACAARALHRLVASLELRGAGLVLRDGERVAAGDLALDGVAAAWAGTDASTLPPIVTPLDYQHLPAAARSALAEAGVLGVITVASPRGRRGHLFIATTLLGNVFTEEDEQALFAFADQLALVLDAAELLARTVQVERSLAHAEKLAAIGETAARIAHEIRNPITAARSLAQQLAREPATPFAEEHAIILEELERVERQVRSLLEFARREELRTAPTDLCALVRRTLASFAPRLEAGGVDVVLDTPAAAVAPIDAEKMRQVVVNLVDNALDALAGIAPPRRLTVAASAQDGVATLTIQDNGPGIAPEALPRLFDPFWSGKPHGTGLGLAIVRRAVEAHGGRVEARSTPGAGTRFDVVVPASRVAP